MECLRNHGAEPKVKAVAVLIRWISQLTGRKVETVIKEIMYLPKNNVEHIMVVLCCKTSSIVALYKIMLYLPLVSTGVTWRTWVSELLGK